MIRKIQKIMNLKFVPIIILGLIIVVQLLNISFLIAERKEGYHSDEMFSYGLSNNFYQPFIGNDDISDFNDMSRTAVSNEWKSGDILREYITVQSDERFRYDSVWYNQTHDRHPPLYFSVLHTICSFFPDTFSPVFGYIINFICFIVTQIFLYKLAQNMLKSKYLALCVCFLWGFSAGAINLTVFIRMYCMLAMWVVIFAYLHSKLYKTKEQPLAKQLIVLGGVTFLGALTQHFFLFVAFVFAVCFCIRYLITKRFKIFFAYGSAVLGGTLLSVAVFPATITHFLGEVGDRNRRLIDELFIAIRYCFDDIFAMDLIRAGFLLTVGITLIVTAAVLSLPVIYLFRDKPKIAAFIADLKTKLKGIRNIKSFSPKKFFAGIWNSVKSSDPLAFIILLSVLMICFVSVYSTSFSQMGYANRYLYVIYPVFSVAVIAVFCFIITKVKFKKAISAVLIIALSVSNMGSETFLFFFDKDDSIESVCEMTKDAQCILLMEMRREEWTIDTWTNEIYDADNFFITYYSDQEKYKNELESMKTDSPIYLFAIQPEKETGEDGKEYCICYDNDTGENVVCEAKEFKDKFYGFYKKLSISKEFEYVGYYTVYNRTYDVYRLA